MHIDSQNNWYIAQLNHEMSTWDPTTALGPRKYRGYQGDRQEFGEGGRRGHTWVSKLVIVRCRADRTSLGAATSWTRLMSCWRLYLLKHKDIWESLWRLYHPLEMWEKVGEQFSHSSIRTLPQSRRASIERGIARRRPFFSETKSKHVIAAEPIQALSWSHGSVEGRRQRYDHVQRYEWANDFSTEFLLVTLSFLNFGSIYNKRSDVRVQNGSCRCNS